MTSHSQLVRELLLEGGGIERKAGPPSPLTFMRNHVAKSLPVLVCACTIPSEIGNGHFRHAHCGRIPAAHDKQPEHVRRCTGARKDKHAHAHVHATGMRTGTSRMRTLAKDISSTCTSHDSACKHLWQAHTYARTPFDMRRISHT
eukprot:1240151-Pleurochrysis_carterae.AAC.2